MPYAGELQAAALPGAEQVVKAALELLGRPR
jgi:hypothetical protein